MVKDGPFQTHNWHSLSRLMAQAISERETKQEATGMSPRVQPLTGVPPHSRTFSPDAARRHSAIPKPQIITFPTLGARACP